MTEAPTPNPAIPTSADEEVDEQLLPERGPGYRESRHSAVAPPARAATGERLPMELSTDDLVARLDKLHDAAAKALVDGVDYGVIPGVDKPSLFKPGAEKLCMLFMLDPETDVEERYDDEGHLSVLARTTMYHAPTGVRIGSGVGSCSTRETRYAYRQAQRVCPECGQETVFKSKQRQGEFFCWSKKGGCGANFDAGTEAASALASVDLGRKRRPPEELGDFYNTVLKMASKRSLVAAVLVTTGASHIYTQDVEDAAPAVAVNVRVDQPGFPVPKNWPQVEQAIVRGYGAGKLIYEDFEYFIAQASRLLYSEESLKKLSTEQRRVMLQKAAGAATWIRENVEDEIVGPSTEQIQEAWASVLDGVELPLPDTPAGVPQAASGAESAAEGDPYE